MSEIGPPPDAEQDDVADEPQSPPQKFPDLVEDIFPSCAFHIIAGSRGAGKTAFEVWMERSVLAGEAFLGHKTWRPPFWGVIILDRSPEDRLQWWAAAEMQPLPYYSLTADPKVNPATLIKQDPLGSLSMVANEIKRMDPPPGSAITIDVVNFLSGDVHLSYRSGFAHGWGIAKMAADYQITIFGVMHGGKQKQGQQYLRLTDRAIASTGFLGTASTISYLATREETAHIGGCEEDDQLFEWEPHHHPPERFVFKRTSCGLFEVSADQKQPAGQDALCQAIMAQLEECAKLPADPDDPLAGWLDGHMLRLMVQASRSTFFRKMKLLCDLGMVETIRSGKSTHYRKRQDPTS